jgi:putative tricarboxylic transport membrane protein
MDYVSGILSGFQVVFQVSNLFYCFVGVFIGTLVGVLPGIGPVGALSMLLPATFGMSPVSAIILFAGIYYGAAYGGSTTSILVNIPGEASSVVTCIDGYQMARNGRPGAALGISAIGSFIGGTFSVVALMLLVFPLAKAAVLFGPPEYFSLICMSMTIVVYLAHGSLMKAIIMAIVGLILSTVGLDFITGVQRFTFRSDTLQDGLGLVPVAMGVFGIAEVLTILSNPVERILLSAPIKNVLPNLEEWKRSVWPIVRGSLLGFPLGILPGGGAIIASFLSYGLEKRLSKHPEKFGKGAIEGVAGPETANNSGAGGAFVPLLAMGIPSNLVMALLLGALMIHGVTPGPRMITQRPDIFWGVIASMYLGNAMLVVLNLPLVGLWVKILKIPYRILMPLILLFCLIGVYSLNNNVVEIIIMVFFGVVGYCLRRLGYEEAPMVLAFVLGPLLERSFRQSLIMSGGSFMIFVQKPLSAISLAISALLIISSGFSFYKNTKAKISVDE